MITHEAYIVKHERADREEVLRIACAEARKKHRLPWGTVLKPVMWLVTPFGHIVVVELPVHEEVIPFLRD